MDHPILSSRLLTILGSSFFLFLFASSAHAQSGCCSRHGGIDQCDSDTGYYLCQDGSQSPSCTCEATEESSSSIQEQNSSQEEPESAFADVSASSSYYEAINWAKSTGIIQGYSDGTFRPNASINRAELMKILVKGGLHVEPPSATNCFPDVGNEWFSSYVCYAASKQWVKGYPDGHFRPSNNLNDAEALKMIVVSTVAVDDMQTGNDCDTTQWYGTYLCTAEQLNIVASDEFDAGETISRGKVTQWLYNALSGKSASLSTDLSFQPDPQTKASGCQVDGPYPDHACTPGAIFGDVTADKVCTSGYSKSVRSVSESTKNKIYAEYGIQTHSTGEYEVDHFISLELGGSNDTANLFPEAAEPKPGFHEKDKVENYLHKQVCDGSISLAEAQKEISEDWLSVFTNMK